MSRRRQSLLLLPLIIAACAMLGGLLGPGTFEVSAASAAPGTDVDASIKAFTRVFAVVEDNFADKVMSDKALYKGAIPGMLRTLDPHSNFFDPKDFDALREDQHGSYSGVGMQVGPRNGKTIVIAPFEGSPAYKAGLRPGDVILSVNDKNTESLSTTEIATLLKGPKGTPVQVVVARVGVDKPIAFNITRGEIPRFSVQNAFWYKPGIAYLDITQFNDNTSKELEEALKKLGEASMTLLILDLRDNPGGVLNEGVAVTGHWLRKGELVVSHRGRTSAEKPYYARGSALGQNYPIVVLVTRYSASAAEIVAGALQDHDRAWILGENTFGKGLVQTVYPLSENTGLALTTARYYTPSGRLIQRDYGNESYFDYYNVRNENLKNPQDVKMTDSGRTVYGGGGITPDENYKSETMDRLQSQLYRNGLFSFTRTYFASHSSHVSAGWMPDEQVLDDLHDYLLKNDYKFTLKEWAMDQEWIKRYLTREMYVWAFNKDQSDRVSAQMDPE